MENETKEKKSPSALAIASAENARLKSEIKLAEMERDRALLAHKLKKTKRQARAASHKGGPGIGALAGIARLALLVAMAPFIILLAFVTGGLVGTMGGQNKED